MPTLTTSRKKGASKKASKSTPSKKSSTNQLELNAASLEAIDNRVRELLYQVAGRLHIEAQNYHFENYERFKPETLVDHIIQMAHKKAHAESTGKVAKHSTQLAARSAEQLSWT